MNKLTLFFIVILIIAVTIISGSCVTQKSMVKEETPVTSIQKLPDGFIEGEQGTYIHKHSGIEFPKNLDSFQRKYLTGFDPYGYHIAITYDNYQVLRAVMTI